MDIDHNEAPDQQMQGEEHDEVSHKNDIVQVMNRGMVSMHNQRRYYYSNPPLTTQSYPSLQGRVTH
jgi:hypothetical protein